MQFLLFPENRMRFSGDRGDRSINGSVKKRVTLHAIYTRSLRFRVPSDSRVFLTFFSPTHFMAREKKLTHEMGREKKLKARPRESIHEIRAAGRESEGTRNRRDQSFNKTKNPLSKKILLTKLKKFCNINKRLFS